MWRLLLVALALALPVRSEEFEWWQVKPIYQVYPLSFQDSNDDGYGDLKGILSRVEHLRYLEVGAVWLSPIYASPGKDNGYDISDFRKIDPKFGDLDDFKDLVKELNSTEKDNKQIRLVMDFVPNHSSDEHPWFKGSVAKTCCEDYYIWKDNGTGPNGEPNNWQSVFGGSAWTYKEERKQWYYHAFGEYQPDLNYRNDSLKQEMKNVLTYWLDLGVFGFRMDAVPFLVESNDFSNENFIPGCRDLKWSCLNHTKTLDQNETYDVLAEFRKLLDSYNKGEKGTRLMVVEAYSPIDKTMEYYSYKGTPVAHMPFNFFLINNLTQASNSTDFINTINAWMDNMPEKMWPNWVIGNHDNSRVGTRMGEGLIDAMNMINLLLPGTPFIYYGEEIGMVDTYVRKGDQKDNQGRDPERTPMQWNSSDFAVFTSPTAKPWLPVNLNYWRVNTKNETDPVSHLTIFKRLVSLHNKIANNRTLNLTNFDKEYVFGLMRNVSKDDQFLVIVNLNDQLEKTNVTKYFPDLPEKMYVYASSINGQANHSQGETVDPKELMLLSGEGLVLSSKLVSGAGAALAHLGLLLGAALLSFWSPASLSITNYL